MGEEDIGSYVAIVLGMVILYFAIMSNRKINADRNSKPVEPIKPVEPTEEPQTTFTKEELAAAVAKGIEEAKKKNTFGLGGNLMKAGCSIMVFQFAVVWLIVIAIIFYVLFAA
tara:strand:- start:94 stop:432 length:339 start_codon:yes stop_codon:yes gene_type:complete